MYNMNVWLVQWLVCSVIGVTTNDIRNGMECVATNRGGRNGVMIIVGVVDEIKLGRNFLMIHCMKYDIIYIIE